MNLKTGLKTIAVAVPMAVAPLKSTAQNVVKEAKLPSIVDARLGAGYGYSEFFWAKTMEPKIVGSIGVRSEDVVAGFEASIGKCTKDFKAHVGVPSFPKNNTYVDAGMVARYQHNSPVSKKGFIPECEVNSTDPKFADEVSINRSKGFLGLYVSPAVKVGDVDLKANVEAGMASFADFGSNNSVARADLPKYIKEDRVVNRSSVQFATNIGVSADAELDSGIRVGAEYNYSTFDNSNSILAKLTYNIDKLFKHKK